MRQGYEKSIYPLIKEIMDKCGELGFEFYCATAWGKDSCASEYFGDMKIIAPARANTKCMLSYHPQTTPQKQAAEV
jgi:hypothetical protein